MEEKIEEKIKENIEEEIVDKKNFEKDWDNRRSKYIKKNRKKRLLKIIEIILVLGILASVAFLVKWGIDGYKRKQLEEDMKQYLREVPEEENENNDENKKENKKEKISKIDFDALKKRNKDVKGWLKVNGTNIDHPIVQAKDNDYYVHTTIDRKYNFGGWPFFDYRNEVDESDRNIIIYGHNMRNGTMFHDLRYVFDKKWYGKKENQIITLYTPTENKKYKIFSMYKVPSEEYYITTYFSDSEFKDFLKKIHSRSRIDFEQGIEGVEQILTLSTCDYNLKHRIVIHAAEIKGEN